MDYDYIIIGSGFGGSVSALRLAEKGYRVAVLEQGRQITPTDIQAANKSFRKLMWMPRLGMNGFFVQHIFQHVGIVGGVGVGGGSLVYAAVLLEPTAAFFKDPAWADLNVDWQAELAPHYETAKQMLGRTANRHHGPMDHYLRETAQALQVDHSYDTVPLGIYFGEPGIIKSDPYFDGEGPERAGCILCGQCLAGCAHNAKNSLDKNYLYLAQQLGAKILPERKATEIRPLPNGGYEVKMFHPAGNRTYQPLSAKKVILAAGVIGTLRLLFHNRDIAQTLPNLSPQLGQLVRTNSEAITAVLHPNQNEELVSDGPTISSHFYANPQTHITQNRFPDGYNYMKWYMGPLIDETRPFKRGLQVLGTYLRHPLRSTKIWRTKAWTKQVSVISTMQNIDNRFSFEYGRSPFAFFQNELKSKPTGQKRPPAYLPEANRAARTFAQIVNGLPLNVIPESVGNLSITAHILGGCHMGDSKATGVINSSHQLFGYEDIYVVDGTAVSANVGVNPSLTIAALAERCMSLIPPLNSQAPSSHS